MSEAIRAWDFCIHFYRLATISYVIFFFGQCQRASFAQSWHILSEGVIIILYSVSLFYGKLMCSDHRHHE